MRRPLCVKSRLAGHSYDLFFQGNLSQHFDNLHQHAQVQGQAIESE